MKYIVCLEPGVWLATWEGDPGRTLIKRSAKQFGSMVSATHALARARKFRDFSKAEIEEIKVKEHGGE